MTQLYEINTRVWLYSLQKELNRKLTLLTIPDELWIDIIEKGFEWIWLMGVWEHSPLSQEELAKLPGLATEITKAFPSWAPIDVIGSPYSIIDYKLNSMLGKPGDLQRLKQKLNDFGARLILDFVPNHYGNASKLVLTNPEFFISIEDTPNDQSLFKLVNTKKGKRWIAYGKDPYFSPWTDTFQLNYFSEKTREYMITKLRDIALVCDGIRCDMAMLCLNEIIQKTWGLYLDGNKAAEPNRSEFWTQAIETIKTDHPNFQFLAEVYWNLGGRLQQMGFDYTYDKDLYDLLESGSAEKIHSHINSSNKTLSNTISFIENHDEKRAIEVFGRKRSIAAAIVMGTLPGMSLYHQGQLEGMKIKIPVQLRQKQSEYPDNEIKSVYNRILGFTRQIIYNHEIWSMLSSSNPHVLAWQWSTPNSDKYRLVAVNYSSTPAQGHIFLLKEFIQSHIEQFIFNDILNQEKYKWDSIHLSKHGLYVDLPPFESHLFTVNPI